MDIRRLRQIIIRSNLVECSNDQRGMMNSTLIKFVNKLIWKMIHIPVKIEVAI